MTLSPRKAAVSLIVRAAPDAILSAFIEPEQLTAFWLSSSSAPLSKGVAIHWEFGVPGATVETTLTRLEPGRGMAWDWSDGTTVDIRLEAFADGTAINVDNAGFAGTGDEVVLAALNATEGSALVLADLKTFLETGTSAGIVRDKARLIQLRS